MLTLTPFWSACGHPAPDFSQKIVVTTLSDIAISHSLLGMTAMPARVPFLWPDKTDLIPAFSGTESVA